jgi:hypothetical protein
MQRNTAAGTHELDGLRESLRQTLEERKRNDENIAALTKALEDHIAELQQAKESVRSMMATVPPTSRVPNNQPPLTTPSESISIPVGKFPDVFWRWIVPTILLLAFIYFVIAFVTNKESIEAAHWEMPQISLMETAQACTLFDRLQERRAHRAGSYHLPGLIDASTSLPPCEQECSMENEVGEAVCPSVETQETEAPTVQEMVVSSRRPLLRRQFLRNLFQRTLLR